MNPLSRQPDPAADEQASLWAARLEGGTLSAADRDALDAWLNAAPSHRTLLSRYCQFSADLEEQLLSLVATGRVALPAEPATSGHASVVEFESAPEVRRRRWGIPHFAGIALAAAAAVAVGLWVARPAVRIETVATATAQRSTITLTDGTRVELNARTSFTFENGVTERHLKLSGGEAFFTVAKDKARPFIIDTPAGSVRVTGTIFNVRTDTASAIEVTVVEGSVLVRPAESAAPAIPESYALGANDYLSAIRGQVDQRKLTPAELEAVLAWRQGQVVFKDVPLRDVLNRFKDYHQAKIYYSAAIDQSPKTVSGPYSIDDLEGSLKTLAESLELTVDHEPNGVIRLKLKIEH